MSNFKQLNNQFLLKNMSEPILIIPLCGYGKRFKAGYKKHKSLLKIDKFNMLEVIGKFLLKNQFIL